MRIIEKRWVDLHRGYQTVLSLDTRLKSNWERALQVAQRRSERTAAARRTRTRQVTGIGVVVFLLICMFLWVGMYYLPEDRPQLLVYLCALLITGSLAGALYMFRRGITTVKANTPPALDLVEAWWALLHPTHYPIQTYGGRAEVDFLKSLSFLDNGYIAVWGLLTSAKRTSDTDVLLIGPNGIWVFEVKYWSGTISRQEGVWSARYERRPGKTYDKNPDEQWQDQKAEITKTLQMRLPSSTAWTDLIKGGIVFAHQNVSFGPISGYKAAYGKPAAWHKRIRETKPVEGFPLKARLQVLDALITYANRHEKETLQIASAQQAARQIYNDRLQALRKYVSERVK